MGAGTDPEWKEAPPPTSNWMFGLSLPPQRNFLPPPQKTPLVGIWPEKYMHENPTKSGPDDARCVRFGTRRLGSKSPAGKKWPHCANPMGESCQNWELFCKKNRVLKSLVTPGPQAHNALRIRLWSASLHWELAMVLIATHQTEPSGVLLAPSSRQKCCFYMYSIFF